jgi:hypothetical protein
MGALRLASRLVFASLEGLVVRRGNHGEMFMPRNSAPLLIILLAVSIILVAKVIALAQADLPKSKLCSASDGGWSSAGGSPTTGQITMSNDGGWCGDRLGITYSSTVFGGAMHLTQQPAHGQVSIMFHQDGTDVYYKPNPGYTGADKFAVLVEFYNIEKPYNVVVK